MRNNAPQENGFTLIELLLAIGVTAVILSALYSMLYATLRGWESSRQRSQRMREARVVMERIEQDLQRAVPYGFPVFRGTGHSLLFSARVSLADAQSGRAREAIARVSYRWQAGLDGRFVLRRDWNALLPENGSGPTEGSESLSSSISGISLGYAFPKPDNAGTQWMDAWSLNQIPEGVRVELLVNGAGSQAPATLRKTIRILQGSPGRV